MAGWCWWSVSCECAWAPCWTSAPTSSLTASSSCRCLALRGRVLSHRVGNAGGASCLRTTIRIPLLDHPPVPLLYHPPILLLYHPPIPLLYHPPIPLLDHPPVPWLDHLLVPLLDHPPVPVLTLLHWFL